MKFSPRTETKDWYRQLKKPSWAPPSFLFGPVWTILYIIIFVTFGQVLLACFRGEVSALTLAPFLLNLMFNFLFTPLQFGLKNNLLASIDIVLILGTLIWALVAIAPFMLYVLWWNIPYLCWVSFATVLQLTITVLNSKK